MMTSYADWRSAIRYGVLVFLLFSVVMASSSNALSQRESSWADEAAYAELDSAFKSLRKAAALDPKDASLIYWTVLVVAKKCDLLQKRYDELARAGELNTEEGRWVQSELECVGVLLQVLQEQLFLPNELPTDPPPFRDPASPRALTQSDHVGKEGGGAIGRTRGLGRTWPN